MNANKSHTLLVLTSLLALGSMGVLFVKTFPLISAQAVYFCQKTFSNVIALPHPVPFLLLVPFAFIFIIGLGISITQILTTRVFIQSLLAKRTVPSQKMKNVIKALQLQNNVDVIEDSKHLSLSYGFIQPRICISTGLIEQLTTNELYAVLLHEKYHLKNRDPLRIVLGTTASRMFFFIPTLGDILRQYVLSKEIEADKTAVTYGARQSLLSVFTKLLTPTAPAFVGIAAFANAHDLEKRIHHITGDQTNTRIVFSKRKIALSFTALLFIVMAVSAPVHASAMNDSSMQRAYFVCPFGDDCFIKKTYE